MATGIWYPQVVPDNYTGVAVPTGERTVHTGDGPPVLPGTYVNQYYRDDLCGAAYRWSGSQWVLSSGYTCEFASFSPIDSTATGYVFSGGALYIYNTETGKYHKLWMGGPDNAAYVIIDAGVDRPVASDPDPTGDNYQFRADGSFAIKNTDTGSYHAITAVGAPGAAQLSWADGAASNPGSVDDATSQFEFADVLSILNTDTSTFMDVSVVGQPTQEQIELN